MAFVFNENLALSKILMSSKNPSGKYSLDGKEVSYEALNATLQKNINEIARTPQLFRENKNTVYSLLERTLDDVQPRRALEAYGMAADVQTVPQGDTVVFTRQIGKQRAKQFITQVTQAGRYETFELAQEKFEIKTSAYGGAARIAIEDFLDGRVQWADYLEIISDGMQDSVFKEIGSALVSAIDTFPATNKVASDGFDEAQFDRLIQTVAVYGQPVIYATLEMAMTMLPSETWISDNMRDQMWTEGRFTQYKGHPLVILPQSFTDETNATKVIPPDYAFIFPAGTKKPIQMVFEGKTLVKSFDNRDWSTELQTYQKFGVGIQTTNNLAVFRNTQLSISNVPGIWA